MSRPLQVLLVDDEPIVGKRLLPSLAKDGYEVEFCENGREALARIDAKPFDIVVTDVRMQDVDGLQILEHVRRRSPRTQVVIITGYATLEVAREAHAATRAVLPARWSERIGSARASDQSSRRMGDP